MLTHEEKIRLNSQIFIAPHLRYFCNKYSNDPECPPHFEDKMKRFCWMKREEQIKYYIIDDELYTLDQVQRNRTTYRLKNPNDAPYRGVKAWEKIS